MRLLISVFGVHYFAEKFISKVNTVCVVHDPVSYSVLTSILISCCGGYVHSSVNAVLSSVAVGCAEWFEIQLIRKIVSISKYWLAILVRCERAFDLLHQHMVEHKRQYLFTQ